MSEKKIAKVSDIMGNIGLIFFASAFLDPVIKGGTDSMIVVLGLLCAFSSWFLSLIMLK